MEENINVQAFEAASDLFSNTEISEVCDELELRTLEDRETNRILAYIHPESDILYPTDLEGKVIDPLTGQKVDLTDAFSLSDPKACLISEPPTASSLSSSLRSIHQKAKMGEQLKNDFTLARRPPKLDDDLTPAKTKMSSAFLSPEAGIERVSQEIIEVADGSQTRQIFIFRSGEKPTVEIVDLLVPINEAGKQVYGDKYNDAILEDFQEQGGVIIPDNQVPDVANGVFDLDSGYVSELLNDIGLSSELISNLQEGNFTGSVLPEINLSEYQLGHIASGFVTGDFPNYLDDLDGLGIYHLDSLPVLENISETF